MSKKIILLNAPPGAGKDFAAQFLVKNVKDCRLDKFARVLKERTHALYGFPNRDFMYYEDTKDIASNDFLGLTPRQAYIKVSETYFKPTHGNRVFGELLSKELSNISEEVIAISDSGFYEEAKVLIEKYGTSNVLLIKIHREGCDFSEDSRDYIELPVVSKWILNKGDTSFEEEVLSFVLNWLDNLEEEPYFG